MTINPGGARILRASALLQPCTRKVEGKIKEESMMYQPIQRTITTPSERTWLRRSPLRRGFLCIPLAIALAWLAYLPTAQAVSPPPDGGYPNGNTAEGTDALLSLTSGIYNTALGASALYHNTTGVSNTAVGWAALFADTTGFNNTANGYAALSANTTGGGNTATGVVALFLNTTGGFNTANGARALENNTTGGNNTANGGAALQSNTTANDNTADGGGALMRNTTGGQNTADGVNALVNNTTGKGNIALGFGAGVNLTTGNYNIDIGNLGVAGESNTTRIGSVGTQTATFIAGIRGVVVPNGVPVVVDTNGHLGTVVSSERFKEAIKPMDKASEAILALKPVTFRYKHELDPEGIPQFGLVAEQVEKVNPDLVARDDQGKVNTVRYEAVNAMLLNEFLKQHRNVKELEAAITRQQEEIKALTASVKEQASQIRKVSVQLKVSNATPRMVVNNQ